MPLSLHHILPTCVCSGKRCAVCFTLQFFIIRPDPCKLALRPILLVCPATARFSFTGLCMSLSRLIVIFLLAGVTAGCACTDTVCMAPDGSSDMWSDITILPGITNEPAPQRTRDGFDPPFNYY